MRAKLRSSKTCLALSVAALLLAVGAVVRLALHQDPRAAKALRTPGSIVAVTRGSEPLELGPTWRILLERAVPSLRQKSLGVLITPPARSSSLIVWMNLGTQVWLGLRPQSCEFEVSRERGEAQVVVGNSLGFRFANGNCLQAFELDATSVSGTRLRVRVVEATPDERLQSIVIHVPPARVASP